jgi:hypothetical protein
MASKFAVESIRVLFLYIKMSHQNYFAVVWKVPGSRFVPGTEYDGCKKIWKEVPAL